MKMTNDLRRQIREAVREHTRGSKPTYRVGLRRSADGTVTANVLLWAEDEDLWDYWPTRMVRTIDDDPAHPGCAELDLYVETGCGEDRELETNVGILIRDGRVVGAHHNGAALTRMKADLHFPIVPWDWC